MLVRKAKVGQDLPNCPIMTRQRDYPSFPIIEVEDLHQSTSHIFASRWDYVAIEDSFVDGIVRSSK